MNAQSEARAAGWTPIGAGYWRHEDRGDVIKEWHGKPGWTAFRAGDPWKWLGPYTTMRAAMRALEGAEAQP